MSKLLKYEPKKTWGLKLIMLGITAVAELAFLFFGELPVYLFSLCIFFVKVICLCEQLHGRRLGRSFQQDDSVFVLTVSDVEVSPDVLYLLVVAVGIVLEQQLQVLILLLLIQESCELRHGVPTEDCELRIAIERVLLVERLEGIEELLFVPIQMEESVECLQIESPDECGRCRKALSFPVLCEWCRECIRRIERLEDVFRYFVNHVCESEGE